MLACASPSNLPQTTQMSVSHIAETLRRIREMESQNTAPSLLWEDDDERHAKWQALCRSGEVVAAIKEARSMDPKLDLPGAHGLINAYREREGLLPPKKRWWWPF